MARQGKKRHFRKKRLNKNAGGEGDDDDGDGEKGPADRRKNNNSNNNKQKQKQQENDTYDLLIGDKGNFKMECYYALQKFHHQRWHDNNSNDAKDAANNDNHNNNSNDNNKVLLLEQCTSEQERQDERRQWRTTLSAILPASFRITKDVPTYLQTKLEQELEDLLQQATEYQHLPVALAENVAAADATTATETGAATEVAPTEQVEEATTTTTATTTSNKPEDDPRRAPLNAADILARRRLTFLPHAHQLGLDRSTIRKNPALQSLHAWLKASVTAGHVTRQETVSMIPPVLLRVQSTDAVLDLCAAPGSKTSQLLEDLSANTVDTVENTGDDNKTTTTTTRTAATRYGGVLIANDASAPRARLLSSQLRRILHHHPVALITAAPAQFWPASLTQFDKILCDVPCSGDGTTRKNLGVWKNWTCAGALALHSLQLQIATKAVLQLLRIGGTLCYSTCSYNPVENEAVVAELLRRANGGLELVDCRDWLTGFRTRPGLVTWKILCEDDQHSARHVKNRNKKHNPKMVARRQAYEEARKTLAAEGSTLEEPNDNSESRTNNAGVAVENGDSEAASAPTALDDCDGDDKDNNNNKNNPNDNDEDWTTAKANMRRKFEPESLDDDVALLAMAQQAGLHYYPSFSDVPANLHKRIKESAFPPTADEAQKFHLERCLRCLPHDNDTGGFFVALLRKTASLSATDRKALARQSPSTTSPEEDEEAEVSEPIEKKAKLDDDDDTDLDTMDADEAEALEGLDPDNQPIKGNLIAGDETCGKDDFRRIPDEIMDPLIEYYGLTDGFDKELYMSRVCGESKVIFYIAKPVKHLFDLGIQKRITIVSSGLKAFQRNRRSDQDNTTQYRVCQEGIAFLVPYMTRRKVLAGLADFRKCLTGNGKAMPLDTFSEAFGSQFENMSTGSFVVILEGFEEKLRTEKMVATMWKCRGGSIDGLVAKVEVDEMLRKLDEIEKLCGNPGTILDAP